jgi:hypothetical protein
LDTNALSAFADADEALLSVLDGTEELCLPVIVLGEKKKETQGKWIALGNLRVPPVFTFLVAPAPTRNPRVRVERSKAAPLQASFSFFAFFARFRGYFIGSVRTIVSTTCPFTSPT